MRYFGTVIRPPSEADSYILQATYGCSHNQCTFCGTYPDKPFSMRPMDEVLEDIALAGQRLPHTPRVFIADGNALVLPAAQLVTILEALNDALPLLRRVGIYASAGDILRKSDAELAVLRQKKLQIIYLGLESGSDEVLRRIDKRATAAEMIEAVHKATHAGIRVSVIALLGLGGVELSAEHAAQTGRVVSEMDPHYLSMLTLMLVPGLLIASSYASNALVGKSEHSGLKRTFTVFGYMFIPIGLSMHLAHNAGHLLNESLGIVPAFQRALLKYTPLSLGEPNWQFAARTIVDGTFLYWIQMSIFAVFYVFSIYAGYRLSISNYNDRNMAFRALVPMLVLSFIFMILNVYLLNLPMAPRHIH